MIKKHGWLIVILLFVFVTILCGVFFYSKVRDSKNLLLLNWGLTFPPELHVEQTYATSSGSHGETNRIYVFSYDDVDAITSYYQGQLSDSMGNLESSYVKDVQQMISLEEPLNEKFQFPRTTKCQWYKNGRRRLLFVWDEVSKRAVLFEGLRY